MIRISAGGRVLRLESCNFGLDSTNFAALSRGERRFRAYMYREIGLSRFVCKKNYMVSLWHFSPFKSI